MLDVGRLDVVVERSPEVRQEDAVGDVVGQLVGRTGTQVGHRRQVVSHRPCYQPRRRRRERELFAGRRTPRPVRYMTHAHTSRDQ